MNKRKLINNFRNRRARRSHLRVRSSANLPRLSVFRSNRYTYAQLIDDSKNSVLAAISSKSIKDKINKTEAATKVGNLIAAAIKSKGINKAVFDRGRYKFHGRVKAVAEGARNGGLNI